MKGILKVTESGNVEVYNVQTRNKIKTIYSGHDSTRADWFDSDNGSVQVQLRNGKVKIIDWFGNTIKTI